MIKSVLPTSLILCIFIIVAGCSITGNNPAYTPQDTRTSTFSPYSVIPAETYASYPVSLFPFLPIALPEKYRSPVFLGSFEDSFIGSYECSNGTESYVTNYTLFTGTGASRHIHYSLVPVDNVDNNNIVPLPSEILNVSISPDDFFAKPGYIYISRVLITVGPNVTGESHTNPDGSGWSRNPYFPFLLNVTIDGMDAADADDRLSVIKWCNIHSQTREMQASPGFVQTPQSDIVLNAGNSKEVNISVRNFGGGIRELYLKIPARINSNSWTFPLDADPGQLLPIPDGMTFSFDPPVMTGNNFRFSNSTLVIGTGVSTPRGNYTFPLVLCYRNLNTYNTTSRYFPFDEISYCGTATQFTADIV